MIDHSPAILNIYNTVNGAINSVGSNPAISSPSILLSDEVSERDHQERSQLSVRGIYMYLYDFHNDQGLFRLAILT